MSEPSIWTILDGWAADLMAQCVPGSVVLLLAIVGAAPWIGWGVAAIYRRARR